MTREEAIKKHRELWHWIADETRKQHQKIYKDENPDVAKEKPRNGCWLCEYVHSINNPCKNCPIKWSGGMCAIKGGEYRTWIVTDDVDYERCANLADIIAELPEKEEK